MASRSAPENKVSLAQHGEPVYPHGARSRSRSPRAPPGGASSSINEGGQHSSAAPGEEPRPARLRLLQVTDLHVMRDIEKAFGHSKGPGVVDFWAKRLAEVVAKELAREYAKQGTALQDGEDLADACSDQDDLAAQSRRVTAASLDATVALLRATIEAEKPDYVVFTGDIWDGRGIEAEEQFADLVGCFLSKVFTSARHKVEGFFYLPGNHERDCDWAAFVRSTRGGDQALGGQTSSKNVDRDTFLLESVICSQTHGFSDRPKYWRSGADLLGRSRILDITRFDGCGHFNFGVRLAQRGHAQEGTSEPPQETILLFFDTGRGTPPYAYPGADGEPLADPHAGGPVEARVLDAAERWLKKTFSEAKSPIPVLVFVHEPLWGVHGGPALPPDDTIQGVAERDHPERQHFLSDRLACLVRAYGAHVFCGHNHHSDGAFVVRDESERESRAEVDARHLRNDPALDAQASNSSASGGGEGLLESLAARGSTRSAEDHAGGRIVAFGRCGSFFPPSDHEGAKLLPFPRGARVIDVVAGEGGKAEVQTFTRSADGSKSKVVGVEVVQ